MEMKVSHVGIRGGQGAPGREHKLAGLWIALAKRNAALGVEFQRRTSAALFLRVAYSLENLLIGPATWKWSLARILADRGQGRSIVQIVLDSPAGAHE
jgi:hypothetical protein